MKKIIVSLSLFGLLISNQNCTKNEDSKGSTAYEKAASTLATANKNYEDAIATNDLTKIEDTKKVLEEAKNKYVDAKNTLISEGGKVKSEYENFLKTSEESIEKTKQTAKELGENTVENAKNTTESAVNETTNNINKTIVFSKPFIFSLILSFRSFLYS